ncbi:MFS transporter [Streptomyces mirabilis]|uniref:MFS transporter n=1 Tax=Streptomyces mirabilis TaxID=68239 RepID=UPI0036C5AF79
MTALSTTSGVKRGTITVFATAITVSNIYFTQPLLEWIAQGLGVSSAAAGIVATAGQVGYTLGIVVIVPLADRARLRRISSVLLAITALALLTGALAPSIAVLSTATFVLSVTTVLPQLIMPTVSSMAARGQAGRALGAVGTGLTLGALLSRTVSGALAEATGTWRAGYFAAAAATALLLLVLPRYMPEQSPHGGQGRIGYLKLLASLPRLIVGHASLRLSAVLGATGFAAFSAFRATLAFHLSQKAHRARTGRGRPFRSRQRARRTGRPLLRSATDRYGPDTVNTVGLASAGITFVVFLFGGDSVVARVIGCKLGYGTTSAQIANQTRIFTGPAALRARLNTVYIFALFASGAIGSSIGLALLEAHGWTVMVWEGMAFLAVGALSLTVHSVRQRRTSGVQNSVEAGPCVAVGRPAGKGG